MGDIINLKLVIIGEGEVGKTSMINSFTGEEWSERYLPTIGNHTTKKEYELKEKSLVIKVNIWDIGGQRSFNPFNPSYYINTDLALLVFDLTRPKATLKNLKKDFSEKMGNLSEDCIYLIVGNKLDLLVADNDFKDILKEFLNEKDNFILVSAKNHENINECFELLVYTYLKKAELLTPNIIQDNTIDSFLKVANKDEILLKEKLMNLQSIDSLFEKKKLKVDLKKSAEKETDKDIKYYEFIQQELSKVNHKKIKIFNQFLINLSEFEKVLNQIKRTRFKSVNEVIKNLMKHLSTSRTKIESNLDIIQKLCREENELMIIKSKNRNLNQAK
ncbi:MAG: Rab family GTPase [Promethearchaeota archaeon]